MNKPTFRIYTLFFFKQIEGCSFTVPCFVRRTGSYGVGKLSIENILHVHIDFHQSTLAWFRIALGYAHTGWTPYQLW